MHGQLVLAIGELPPVAGARYPRQEVFTVVELEALDAEAGVASDQPLPPGVRIGVGEVDQGVVQDVVLKMAPGEVSAYCEIDVVLELVAGDFDTWRRVNRTFLDDLRKQFLVWRTLSPEDRAFYVEKLSSRWGA